MTSDKNYHIEIYKIRIEYPYHVISRVKENSGSCQSLVTKGGFCMFLAEILKDDFVDIRKVYEEAKKCGLKKADVKAEKYRLGVKTLQVSNKDGDDMWLWYLPERIWEKYHV